MYPQVYLHPGHTLPGAAGLFVSITYCTEKRQKLNDSGDLGSFWPRARSRVAGWREAPIVRAGKKMLVSHAGARGTIGKLAEV
jgi:hypothetical protein